MMRTISPSIAKGIVMRTVFVAGMLIVALTRLGWLRTHDKTLVDSHVTSPIVRVPETPTEITDNLIKRIDAMDKLRLNPLKIDSAPVEWSEANRRLSGATWLEGQGDKRLEWTFDEAGTAEVSMTEDDGTFIQFGMDYRMEGTRLYLTYGDTNVVYTMQWLDRNSIRLVNIENDKVYILLRK